PDSSALCLHDALPILARSIPESHRPAMKKGDRSGRSARISLALQVVAIARPFPTFVRLSVRVLAPAAFRWQAPSKAPASLRSSEDRKSTRLNSSHRTI